MNRVRGMQVVALSFAVALVGLLAILAGTMSVGPYTLVDVFVGAGVSVTAAAVMVAVVSVL